MTNIIKEFTYDIADDQYYQTNDSKKTGTLTYTGPDTVVVIVDAATNKLTGQTVSADVYDTYNEVNTNFYAVKVDCNKDTLICALMPGGIDSDAVPSMSEEVPGSELPYVRPNPPMPDHTYELTEIVYDVASNVFVKPFPWKKPYVTWENKISWRNNALNNSDRTLSEDLPESLYTAVAEYKQYLRDFTEFFGASFSVTVAIAGTGYSVGDRMLISDPAYKNSQAVPDILVTVSAVSDTGGITGITKTTTKAYEYHPGAATYNNVYYTTSSAGAGATFNMSKVKTVDPWKITPKESPLM